VILYEVNLDVDGAIFAAYRTWLDEHIRAMLTLPGFIGAEVFELREPTPAAQRRSLCVHYRLADAADLDRYLRIDAPRMRAEGETRFPGQFHASRRILQPLLPD
jgi:antibiotic biosynthesis monooxygenase (ABM) superfamily enzyme